jgi:4'-phosphopantetheinyl transferase
MEIYKEISLHTIANSVYYNAWLIDIREFTKYIDDIKNCLSDLEIRKCEEIVFSRQKELFYMRKGITRIILSRLLNINPRDIQYEYSFNGKPLIKENDKNIQFNISHSKEYLLVAAAQAIDIGVDIEKINYSLDYSLIAKDIFSPEEMKIFNSYSKKQQLYSFYKAWVQKEAVSKALGLGLSIGFNSFSVNIDPKLKNEEYNININNRDNDLKLRVSLENNYALAIALVKKGV